MSLEKLKPHTDIRYRADVDGLRAVAILAVLIFHGFPTVAPGGFIGVDVFFVISGFLITQIITNAVERNKFSYKTFYYRRARRLLPSLAVVFLAVAAVSPIFLFGSEIVLLGKHILSGLLFTSNFRLVNEAGYFDTDSAAKPFLNLWSLGVEEQFYLFWPLLITALYAWKKHLRLGLVALWLISFGLNIYLLAKRPKGTFYLPHTRFWEMITGALITFISRETTARIHNSRWLRTTLSTLGFVLIGVAIAVCDARGPYPGWLGLLPVFGAAAIMLSGPQALWNRVVLSSSPAIFIGYISYPLYLWHWPMLAYLHVASFSEASALARGAVAGASILMAIGTFYLLELPIRDGRRNVSVRQIFSIFIGIAAMAILMQKFGERINALPESISLHKFLTKDTVEKECLIPAEKKVGKDAEYCYSDVREKPTYAVWGDSKSDAIYAGLVPESKPGARWLLMGHSGCGPFTGVARGFYSGEDGDSCLRSNRLMLEALTSHPEIKTVLVAVAARVISVPKYHDPEHPEIARDPADGLIASLKALVANGKRVGFLVDNPTLSDPEQCVARPLSHRLDPNAECEITVEQHRARTQELQAVVGRIRRELPMITIIDPTDILCPEGHCRMIGTDGNFMYGFSDHVSDIAAKRIADRIISELK